MPELFTLPELDAWTQTAVPVATGTLVRELVTTLIRSEVGAARYDALTDLSVLKPVALDVARRALANPGGVRSEQVDDYSVTYATEFVGGAALTEAERRLVRAAAGLTSSGAFTIRPAAPRYC